MNSVEKFRTDLNRKRTAKSIEGMLTESVWLSYYDTTNDIFTIHGYRIFHGYLPTDLVDYNQLSVAEFKLAVEHAMTNTQVRLQKEADQNRKASLPKVYHEYQTLLNQAFDLASQDHGKTKEAIQLVDKAMKLLEGTPFERKYHSYEDYVSDYNIFCELMCNGLALYPDDAYQMLHNK